MKRITAVLFLCGALGFVTSAATPSAAAPSASSPQYRPYQASQTQSQFRSRLSDRQLLTILTRVRQNTELLERTVDGTPAAGRAWGNYSRTPDSVAYLLEDLQNATDHQIDHLNRRVAIHEDINDLFRRADAVNRAMARTGQNQSAQRLWSSIRQDIDRVANSYSLDWDWNNPRYSNEPARGIYTSLAGTYTLDVARSDNSQRVMDAALRNVSYAERERVSRQLTARLQPPERLAIERTGNQFVVASSMGRQMTLQADGQPRTETGVGGRNMTTRVTSYGDRLEVSSTGIANNEFGLTFEPLNGGDQLRVTRRIYSEGLRTPVTVQSIYRRTSATPDWNIYDSRYDNPSTYPGRPGRVEPRLLVPNGTMLVARLDQTVNLQTAREDDAVTLTVHNAPTPELEGATIEGVIMSSPTRVGDRSRVAVDFTSIRLRNGRSGDFDGVIERVISPNGQTINFNGEVATVDRSTSGDALQRGTIGAAIGGLIGALAGGGKGAAIGAAIGGGGAAATVLLDDNGGRVELLRGTEFTIRARTR